MEFLEAFKQAQTMGLTKEEFLGIWKAEVEQKQHSVTPTLHQATYGDLSQKDDGAVIYKESGQPQSQSLLDWQKHEKLNGNLQWNFQLLYNQLMEKGEHHWQQMQLNHDKLIDKFSSSFEILSKHVSNIVDLNERSVKLYFMQELELLKQELGKVIKEEIKVNRSSGNFQSEISIQHTQLTNAQHAPLFNAQQTQLSNAQQTQLTNAQHAPLFNAQQTQLSSAQQTQLTNAQQTQLTNAQYAPLFNAQQTQLTNAQQTQLTNAQHAPLFNAQQTQLSNVQDMRVCPKVPANDKSNNNKSVPVKNNVKDTQDNNSSKSYLPLFPTLQQQNHNPIESNFEMQIYNQKDVLVEEQGHIFEYTPSTAKTTQQDVNWGITEEQGLTFEYTPYPAKTTQQDINWGITEEQGLTFEYTPYPAKTAQQDINWGATGEQIHVEVDNDKPIKLNTFPGKIKQSLSGMPVVHAELHSIQAVMGNHEQSSIDNLYLPEFNQQKTAVINNNFVTQISQEIKVQSYANIVTSKKELTEGEVKAYPLDAVNRHTPPIMTPNKKSIRATGSYAEAISNQMNGTQLLTAGCDQSKNISNFSCPVNNLNKIKTSKLPNQKLFTIFDSDQFSISNTHFPSPFAYSSGKKCRVRVRVNFEQGSVLTAHVHVSKGEYDDNHKWPLVLSGTGYIWNQSSYSKTQIWQLLPVPCKMPLSSKGAFVFPTSVCLSTSRGKYPNVNYQKLVEKNYTIDNCVTFIWDVEAVEK